MHLPLMVLVELWYIVQVELLRYGSEDVHVCYKTRNVWYVKNLTIICRWEALGQLTVAFSLLGVVYWLSALYDAPCRKPCVGH